MKKFIQKNWFKLMAGSSMLVFSFGFLLHAVAPVHANQSDRQTQPKMENNEDIFAVSSDGYLYMWTSKTFMRDWTRNFTGDKYKPERRKLPTKN